ncbi:hypothetical protein CTI14_21890 [Methylobacterium radiotolerans]|nr:hypothetical protein CTI14_21890 [Methylobacterium radiotolerans]
MLGTPVALITTVNPDGSSNISPISSAWALGTRYMLGLGAEGQAAANIERVRDLVINLPSADLVHAVEAIAPTTGRSPVPAEKVPAYRHEPDKWSLGGFTPMPSDVVIPFRIAECPVQIEARVAQIIPIDDATRWRSKRRSCGPRARGHPEGARTRPHRHGQVGPSLLRLPPLLRPGASGRLQLPRAAPRRPVVA